MKNIYFFDLKRWFNLDFMASKTEDRKRFDQRILEMFEDLEVFEVDIDYFPILHQKQDFSFTLKMPLDRFFVSFKNPFMRINPNGEKCADVGFYVQNFKTQIHLLSFGFYDTVTNFAKKLCYHPINEYDIAWLSYVIHKTKTIEVKVQKSKKGGLSSYIYPGFFRYMCPNPKPNCKILQGYCIGFCSQGIMQTDCMNVSLFINIINFLNSKNIIKKPVHAIGIKKRRKLLKSKKPLPPPAYYICKVTDIVKPYKKSFGERAERYFTYSFSVRGHFRFLRNERFTKKRFQTIWVKPHIKGEGIFIPKIRKKEENG